MNWAKMFILFALLGFAVMEMWQAYTMVHPEVPDLGLATPFIIGLMTFSMFYLPYRIKLEKDMVSYFFATIGGAYVGSSFFIGFLPASIIAFISLYYLVRELNS